MSVIRERFLLVTEPAPQPPARSTLLDGMRAASAVICTLTERIDQEALDAAPSLRVIANYAVGYNNIAVEAARARSIVVTNTPDVLTETTADLTWALLLAAARHVPEGDALVRAGAWAGWEATQLLGSDVHGKTLGLIGMGRIGKAVARRAAGFQMSVLYWSRSPLAHSSRDPQWQEASFEELLSQSDFVSVHVPLTDETEHLLGVSALRLMRPTAYLINTSRGPVVDEHALVTAIQEGRLAGAGLDVYEHEPDVTPALRALPQVVLLPHLGSATLRTRIDMGMMCVENVTAVLEGRPAPNEIRV